ncbi:hypothetical protein [Helicobacter sp. T3_23-1059]
MIDEIQQDYQEAIEQEATQDTKLFERIELLSNACNNLLEDFENLAEHTMDLKERMDNVEKSVKTQEAESSAKTSDDNFVYIDKLIKDDTLEREKAMKEEILQAIKANQHQPKKSNSAQNIINFLVIFGIIVCLFLITKNQNTGATNGSTNNSSSSKNSTKNIRSK